MRLWPFRSEHRAADVGATAVEHLLAGASTSKPSPVATATAASAVSTMSSALSTAIPSALPGLLTPSFLADYAQRMILSGEAIYMIDVDVDGQIALIPSFETQLKGGYSPLSWLYEVSLPRPGQAPVVRRVPAAGIVHVRWGQLPTSPWAGRSPLARAGVTGEQLARIEQSLLHDASVPTGGLMPLPDGATQAHITQAATALKTGKGHTSTIETTSSGFGQGPSAKPAHDWEQKRFGPEPPQENVLLRNSTSDLVLGALGVNSKLLDGDGSSAMAAWRLLLLGPVQTLASLLESEVADKLKTPLRLDLSPAGATDVRGLGRAVGSLVGAGMDLRAAMAIAGLDSRLVKDVEVVEHTNPVVSRSFDDKGNITGVEYRTV